MIVVLTSCLQSHAFPTELSWQVLIEGSLTPLFVHHLTFGLTGLIPVRGNFFADFILL